MNIGVIFAGGVGTRMRSKDKPKQFLELHGKPIIVHTLGFFQDNGEIDAIVIACHPGYLSTMEELVARYRVTKVRKIVPGGQTGQLSIYNGLCAAEEIARGERSIVLIHDGVRPLISSRLLSENIAAVRQFGSCITAGTVKETLAVVDAGLRILEVPDRACSRVAKAPQSFWLDDIISAHRSAMAAGRTDHIDSCTLMKRLGRDLHMIDGPYDNIKITTPDDFFLMRAILDARENEQLFPPE